ncbi:MAG: sugar transferase [Candidatus Paceibacterota bacterium]|jgi:lipopolysaccharide/colanic/teichoic acid biosynthesis glycosyltransferase
MKLQKNLHISLVLLVDVVLLVVSLYLALILRYFFDGVQQEINNLFAKQILYFTPLFGIIISVLYISLSYSDTTLAYLRRSIPKLAESLTISAVTGIAYFYIFATYLPISPKVTYALFFIVSFFMLSVSRLAYAKLPLLGANINALVIIKMSSIYKSAIKEVAQSIPRATFSYAHDFSVEGIVNVLLESKATLIVYDNTDKEIVQLISMLPTHIIRNVSFLSGDFLYEQSLGKIFLPTFTEESLLRDYLNQKPFFEITKRVFDVCIAIPLLIFSIPFIAIACFAIYLETGFPVFIFQERLGLGRKIMRIPKLRSMSRNENGVWTNEGENRITRVGAILRKTRIDELPQLWSVVKGDMSLIGPRPDITGLEERLSKEIDFYHARYTVPPGLSGWAQVTQTVVPSNVEETRERFAYDMYYIKNRSVFLDFSIALKTVRILLSRVGH